MLFLLLSCIDTVMKKLNRETADSTLHMSQQECCAGFTKTVGLEMALKGNITCNAICPGYVLTDLIRNQLEDTAKARGISKVLPLDAQAKRQSDLADYMHSLNFWCGSRRCITNPHVG